MSEPLLILPEIALQEERAAMAALKHRNLILAQVGYRQELEIMHLKEEIGRRDTRIAELEEARAAAGSSE